VARIAITGGSGFIGKHLIPQLLSEKHEIRLATRKAHLATDAATGYFQVDLLTASDTELESFLDGCEVLIHLAGETSDQSFMRPLHVDATRRLTRAAAAKDIAHWIQMSSCGVYGPVRSGVVVENSSKAPVGEYEVTKWESEKIVNDWAISNDRKVTIFRPSIVWSSTMPNNSLRALVSVVRRKLFFFVGERGSIYPCVHVDDVVRAVSMSIQYHDRDIAIFNLSDNILIEDLIGTIASVTNSPVPTTRIPESWARMIATLPEFLPFLPLTRSRVNALSCRAEYCSAAARNILGWQPKKLLRDGLAEFEIALAPRNVKL
jgi:nucleoside-diphosphate-sugar epimerase